MIVIKKRRSAIPYKYIWFARKPETLRAVDLVIYAQCGHAHPCLGFIRRKFSTKIVDLQASGEELLKNMSRKGAFDVKRAMRDGVQVRDIGDVEEFLTFYNSFAPQKGLAPVGRDDLAGWGRQIAGLTATIDGVPAAMHTYVVDRDRSRARLLHSASLFRQAASAEERTSIGRANRLLHYQAMLRFKELGLAEYDLGGYAKDSPDPQLANIAKFKDTLGGREVREDHFVSLPLYVLQQLGSLMSYVRSAGAGDLARLWPKRAAGDKKALTAQRRA